LRVKKNTKIIKILHDKKKQAPSLRKVRMDGGTGEEPQLKKGNFHDIQAGIQKTPRERHVFLWVKKSIKKKSFITKKKHTNRMAGGIGGEPR